MSPGDASQEGRLILMAERKSNLRKFKSPRQKSLETWQSSGEAALDSGVYRLDHKENHLMQEEMLVQKGICLPSCAVCGKPIRFHLIQAVTPITDDPDFG